MSRIPVYDPARTFDATNLTASYKDVGAVLGSAAVGFTIYNTSDVDVQVSFDDGSTNGPIIPSDGSFSNGVNSYITGQENRVPVLPKGAQIQVKQVTGAGSSGDVVINIIRKS